MFCKFAIRAGDSSDLGFRWSSGLMRSNEVHWNVLGELLPVLNFLVFYDTGMAIVAMPDLSKVEDSSYFCFRV